MSRLADIIENHDQLDRLNGLFKHYGVNAEFVTAAVIEQYAGKQEEADEQLMTDLKQLFATL